MCELEKNKIGAFMYYLKKSEIKGRKFKKKLTQTPNHKHQIPNSKRNRQPTTDKQQTPNNKL